MDTRFSSLDGKVQRYSPNVQYLHCLFFYFFNGFTGLLLCLNTSWNCAIYVRCYRLCSVLNRSKPLNKFQYSSGPGNAVQRMEFCCFLLYNFCFYIYQKLVLWCENGCRSLSDCCRHLTYPMNCSAWVEMWIPVNSRFISLTSQKIQFSGMTLCCWASSS